MIMNTQQLQHLLEIERTGSISQAAANLFMGQPNLSRLLREMESSLGFAIFERTRKGVRPTQRGALFLQHARNILREAAFMEQLGPNAAQSNRFRICLPRSYTYVELVQQFLCSHVADQGLDAMIRECHPRRAMELLENGLVEIAVIRYAAEFQDYFTEQAQTKEFSMRVLSETEYGVLVSSSHPLSGESDLTLTQLDGLTELIHRDSFFYSSNRAEMDRQLYTVDRLAQMQLLQTIPNSCMWSEPLPQRFLESMGLSMHRCEGGGTTYRNALLFKPQCAMSQMEKAFLEWLIQNNST